VYRICLQRLEFQAALEAAYKSRVRPICLSRNQAPDVYRPPRINLRDQTDADSGASHGPGCESYEAPPGLSGRGEVDGQAIEHDDEGTVNLKLAFSLRHNNPLKWRMSRLEDDRKIRAPASPARPPSLLWTNLNSLTGNGDAGKTLMVRRA